MTIINGIPKFMIPQKLFRKDCLIFAEKRDDTLFRPLICQSLLDLNRPGRPRMCSREELVLILGSAASQNPADIKAAEEKLKSLETEKGFYHALSSVVSDASATVPVRWQAVLYVKNGIDRYW